MAIHVCITCDAPGCKIATSAGFDGLGETYGDLVAALPSIGWSVETDGHSRTARCRCPEHAGEEVAARPMTEPDQADIVAMRPFRDGDLLPVRSSRALMLWLLPRISDDEARSLGTAAERELIASSMRSLRPFMRWTLSAMRGRLVELRELSADETAALPRWDQALGRYYPS